MPSPKKVILIGAGDRGRVYAAWAEKNPRRLAIAGVAEPLAARRNVIAKRHDIAPSRVFDSWEEILSLPKFADGAIIATQDGMHAAPALAALGKGYRVLLEKPMAVTPGDCGAIVRASRDTGLPVSVCHVLRYTKLFSSIKKIIDGGMIGRVATIFHAENVAYYHMAHSFVRGNWRRVDSSSPMILAKCCHDLDLIAWYAGSRPKRVSSIGGLHRFRVENAPQGAPERCTDGCPVAEECPYHAVEGYLRGIPLKRALSSSDSRTVAGAARIMLAFPGLSKWLPVLSNYHVWKEWPTSTITGDLNEDGIMKALREGPYGRCVYRCDNDQADHQETTIEFENGVTAVLRMHGLSAREGRTLRIDGTRGTLRACFGGGTVLEVQRHGSSRVKKFPVKGDFIGHSEGDRGVMENFVTVLEGGPGLTTAGESLVSHELAFAAHRARGEGRLVEMESPASPANR
jgi:predicted dehydrogenase